MTDIDAIRRTYRGMTPEQLLDVALHLHTQLDRQDGVMGELRADVERLKRVKDNYEACLDASNGQLHIIDAWLRRNVRIDHDGRSVVDRTLEVLDAMLTAKPAIEHLWVELMERWGNVARLVGRVVDTPTDTPRTALRCVSHEEGVASAS